MVIAGHQEREVEQWQRARFITWITACTVTSKDDRQTIFEFLPLPGDPSAEEQQKMKDEMALTDYKDAKKLVEEGAAFVKMLQNAAQSQK